MKHRKLRIAWSVAWGVVCLSLMALWLRGYAWDDVAYYSFGESKTLTLRSTLGEIEVSVVPRSSVFLTDWGAFSLHVNPEVTHPNQTSWTYSVARNRTLVRFPLWFPVLIASVLFIAPISGMLRRFSLRSLLIAMTLVGVLLGLMVWLR